MDLIDLYNGAGAQNYHPLPVVLTRGQGAHVWDTEGHRYLDFLSCYSALNFGHQHPRLVAALKTQADELSVCSRAFYSEALCHFVDELARFCGMDQVLPMNTGTEAIETALKGARKWGYEKKGVEPDSATIIGMQNSFHGRSISILSLSSEPLYRKGFGPFTPGFKLVPFGDIEALRGAIDSTTVAVLLEPIQAEAGILVPPPGYLKAVRTLTTEKGVLLILDEIQTGLGRTGKDFACEHDGIKPDVLVLGKSLGGGLLPLSAVVASRDFMSVFTPGNHGSTFGGNPLACSVGREALRVLRDEKLAERASQLEPLMFGMLRSAALPLVREIRGKGLLAGIELEPRAGGARRYCEAMSLARVLCKETHDHVIRIAPPLTISETDLKAGLEVCIRTIQEGAGRDPGLLASEGGKSRS